MKKKISVLVSLMIMLSPFFVSNNSIASDDSSPWVSIQGEYAFSMAVRNDGKLFAWGGYHEGMVLGLGDKDQKIPVIVTAVSNLKEVKTGGTHILYLKKDGTVWASGGNRQHQLGPSHKDDFSSKPILVPGLKNIVSIAAGSGHSLALKSDGTVWAWGNNDKGQLGNGKTGHTFDLSIAKPIQVKRLNHIKSIASYDSFSLALRSDGTVWSWGDNGFGETGTGLKNDYVSTPTQLISLNNILSIATGKNHAIALQKDGSVWCWGYNYYGQVGNGSTLFNYNTAAFKPIKVLTNVSSISAGAYHSIAVKKDGTVWAWGSGDANSSLESEHRTVPMMLPELSDVKQAFATYNRTFFLKKDGTIWCIGSNGEGQLGDGTATNAIHPVKVQLKAR
jgi:alpha-tubulin suppressor-like RCC1 family protein